jgi:hypothetical protein
LIPELTVGGASWVPPSPAIPHNIVRWSLAGNKENGDSDEFSSEKIRHVYLSHPFLIYLLLLSSLNPAAGTKRLALRLMPLRPQRWISLPQMCNSPHWVRTSSLFRLRDHTQTHLIR